MGQPRPNFIDLRSDTVTKPTDEMRRAMANAEVGDDVYGEDPTVRELEQLTADMLGKEAALFVTSGTQGNQVAIATHAGRGEEVLAEAESHIFYYEAAAVSAIAGAQIRQIKGTRGVMNPAEIEAAIREPNVHHPRTALISLENTHNRAGGTVLPLDNLEQIHHIAKRANVPVHMDGARLFNAAVALGVKPTEITQHVDTVQVCLSKGLCAPIGSLIAGPKSFIDASLQWRKRLGGGMRQVGVIAAPGLIALRTMVDRLAEDHANAHHLAVSLANIPGLAVDLETVQTNIVIVDMAGLGCPVQEFLAELKAESVLASSFGPTLVRFVTNHDVSSSVIKSVIDIISSISTRIICTRVKKA